MFIKIRIYDVDGSSALERSVTNVAWGLNRLLCAQPHTCATITLGIII